MVFIPNTGNFSKGDKVRLTESAETLQGTFTAGHVFTVVDYTLRGWDLEDEDGNCLYEYEILGGCYLEKVDG